MTTTKVNRAELLQMAIDGKVKRGDKFKDERGWEVTFDGTVFRWESGSTLTASVHPNEHFTPVFVDREVTITLKQSEINAIGLALGHSVYGRVRDEAQRRNLTIPSGSGHSALFVKLDNMRK